MCNAQVPLSTRMCTQPALARLPAKQLLMASPVYTYLGSADDIEVASILRDRSIPWESYSTAKLITDKESSLIRRYDKKSEDQRASMLDETGPAHMDAFLSILRNVTKEESVQYMLALLLRLLHEKPARARLFHHTDQGSGTPADPYTVFLRLLQRPDWFTQDKAARLLTVVVESRPKNPSAFSSGILSSEPSSSAASTSSYGAADPAEQHVAHFVDWLVAQLRKPSNPKALPTATSVLSALLKDRGARALFLRAGGVQTLAPLIKGSNTPANSQLLYELCMCVWQMTYVKQAAEVMGTCGMVKAVVDVARVAQKEKVFRVSLSSLRNLLGYQDMALASDMVEAGLPKIVATRMLQTWGDEDVVGLLGVVDEALQAGITVLSSWDKYKKEVLSGALDWSPMHTSELFWKANVEKFEEKDFQVLRVLLKLIEASREVRTLAVGCWDLGQFIEYHPQGRYIVGDLRGKELVMRLMAHPDPEVMKQALLTVQKIMLSKDKLDFLTQ